MVRRSGYAIELEGPFFERDPRRTFRANARRLMERAAQVGEAEVKRRIAGSPRRTAGPSFSARFIRGRIKSLSGKPWQVTMVVSADTTPLDGPGARRVQAALSGRRTSVTRRSFGGRAPTPIGTNVGTAPGHEDKAQVFRRTAVGLRRLMRAAGKDLLEGLG